MSSPDQLNDLDGPSGALDNGRVPENEQVTMVDATTTCGALPNQFASGSDSDLSDLSSDPISDSIATLKPVTAPATTTAMQHLTVETGTYVDPTPPTPTTSQPPSRSASTATPRRKHDGNPTDPSPVSSDAGEYEKADVSEDDSDSQSEIQSIMEQFGEGGRGPGADEVMSPRLEIASPLLTTPIQHPPRKSSLEPLVPSIAAQLQEMQEGQGLTSSSASKEKERDDDDGPPVPPKNETMGPETPRKDVPPGGVELPLSPTASLHRPPPPEPEPEPTLAFDFHSFLEQLRNKKADPVARYLKSFLSEFGKRQWMVHEQVKIISDFLSFIGNKMAQCEVWRDVSDAEFDNAREGMEKLVMNRLYTQTFSPAIPPPQPVQGPKHKRRGADRPLAPVGPGRRGQHQEDVERDEILAQKIAIYGWVEEAHLDIPPVNDSGKRFLKLAQQELLKIKSYRAPRDKIICVLNCCKVIFGLLKHSKSDSSADSFMPMLIYVVLHANPEHLVSNVQYILRFRNQDKLGGEAGYYLSSLMGAIQFIENMDRTTLTIADEEFEANVEAAVSAIAEKHRIATPPMLSPLTPTPGDDQTGSLHAPGSSRGSTDSQRPSFDADAAAGDMTGTTPRTSMSPTDGRNSIDGSAHDEKAAISGLLRTIKKPLSTIGRIFSEESSASASAGPALEPSSGKEPDGKPRPRLTAEEAAARQATAEAAEAQRLSRAEHANVVETLAGMFPDLDRDLISDVVYQKEGRVGLAVDACLTLSA